MLQSSILKALGWDDINYILRFLSIVDRINFSRTCKKSQSYSNLGEVRDIESRQLSDRQKIAVLQILKHFEKNDDVKFNAQMGFGKTTVAFFIGFKMLQYGLIDHVYILTPNQKLTANWHHDAIDIGISFKGRNSIDDSKVLCTSYSLHSKFLRDKENDTSYPYPEDKIVVSSYSSKYSRSQTQGDVKVDTIKDRISKGERFLFIVDEAHLLENKKYARKAECFKFDNVKYLKVSASYTVEQSDIYIEPTYNDFQVRHFTIDYRLRSLFKGERYENDEGEIESLFYNWSCTIRKDIINKHPEIYDSIVERITSVVLSIQPNYIRPIIVSNIFNGSCATMCKYKRQVTIDGITKSVPLIVPWGGTGVTFTKYYNDPYCERSLFFVPTSMVEGINLYKSNLILLDQTTEELQRTYQKIGRVIRVGNTFDTITIVTNSNDDLTTDIVSCLEYIYSEESDLDPSQIEMNKIRKPYKYVRQLIPNLTTGCESIVTEVYRNMDIREKVKCIFDI